MFVLLFNHGAKEKGGSTGFYSVSVWSGWGCDRQRLLQVDGCETLAGCSMVTLRSCGAEKASSLSSPVHCVLRTLDLRRAAQQRSKGTPPETTNTLKLFQIWQLKTCKVLQGFVIKIWSITWFRHDYDSTFVHMGNTVHTVPSLQEISSPLRLADPQFSPVLFISARRWNDSFEMFFPSFLQTGKQPLQVWQTLLLIRENGFVCLLEFLLFTSRGRKTSSNGKVWPTICI